MQSDKTVVTPPKHGQRTRWAERIEYRVMYVTHDAPDAPREDGLWSADVAPERAAELRDLDWVKDAWVEGRSVTPWERVERPRP